MRHASVHFFAVVAPLRQSHETSIFHAPALWSRWPHHEKRSFSKHRYGSFGFNLIIWQKIKLNDIDEVWINANSLFKWYFRFVFQPPLLIIIAHSLIFWTVIKSEIENAIKLVSIKRTKIQKPCTFFTALFFFFARFYMTIMEPTNVKDSKLTFTNCFQLLLKIQYAPQDSDPKWFELRMPSGNR